MTTEVTTRDDILTQFLTVTLEETLRVRLFDRVDTKYIMDARTLNQLLPQLTTRYSVLNEFNTSILHYRNIYFDTVDRSMYLAHHNGRSMRFKVRLREYTDFRSLFLEIKRKYKGKTVKDRIALGSGVLEDLHDGSHMIWPQGAQELFQEAGLHLDLTSLVGVMRNEFDRITLLHEQRTERVTIDLGVSFKNLSGVDLGVGLEHLVVVEVKQERDRGTSQIRDCLRSLGIRPSGMSKYCIGTTRLVPDMKYNAFKETNNRIERYTNAIH